MSSIRTKTSAAPSYNHCMPQSRFALFGLLVVCLLSLPVPAAAQAAKGPGLADLSRSLQDLAEKVSPSVVQIFVTGYGVPDESDRTATGDPVIERGSGSGVIVSED